MVLIRDARQLKALFVLATRYGQHDVVKQLLEGSTEHICIRRLHYVVHLVRFMLSLRISHYDIDIALFFLLNSGPERAFSVDQDIPLLVDQVAKIFSTCFKC